MTTWRLILPGLVLFLSAGELAAQRLPHAAPQDAGMDAAHLARIDQIVAQGIAEKKMPGCVVCLLWWPR